MVLLDSFNNAETVSIYLSRPSGELIGCLDEYIDTKSASMVRGLNQQQELSFSINKNDNPWFEHLQEGMYLYVDTIGLFRIKQPPISCDGIKEIKSINAVSCDSELEDKTLNLEINMGTETSIERIISFDPVDASEEVINPYTNIPYDWIVVYNTFPEQLTKHLTDYNNGYFGTPNTEITVTDSVKVSELSELFRVIPRLKHSFTKTTAEDGSTDYTLVEYANITTNITTGEASSITLLNTYKSRITYLIDFYNRNRNKLSLLSIILDKTDGVWSVGDIYGVSSGDYTLANMKRQFDISGNLYSFLTSDFAKASECMVTFDIFKRKVNVAPVSEIGENTGITISYDNLLNTLNIAPNDDYLITRLYVKGANDLTISQVNFGLDYIDDLSYKMNAVDENGNRIYVSDTLATKYNTYLSTCDSLRNEYIQLLKDNTDLQKKINEIKYRVPNDDLKTDWGTFTQDELKSSLTAYKNLLVSLVSMYRAEYYPQGFNQDDSINETFLKTTVYWQDYVAYNGIIKEIECALAVFPYYSDHEKWSSENITQYENAIKEWETNWDLYGTIELQAKIDNYKANMDLLAESAVIRTASNADTIKTWNNLTTDEKARFGNISEKYQYDIYNEYYTNMVSAKSHLATLQTTINGYESQIQTNKTRISQIIETVAIENNFTSSELKTINLMTRDSDYSNENIFTTNIQTVDEETETRLDLLSNGKDELSKISRPQLTFSIASDNLIALKDYALFWGDFVVGNYIMVQYRDDAFVKLRMIGYKYNPFLPNSDDFTITFSNYIRSKIQVTDLENLLGLSSGSVSRSSSGSSGSTSGDYYGSSDNIDVTISNTMLAKLLSTETFGTKVKDIILNTITANYINAQSATFKGLYDGTTTIDGGCIKTGCIKSENYNGTNNGISNTQGSILRLNDGKFNFGGGKLIYDGTGIKLKGYIDSESGYIGGWTINNHAITTTIHEEESEDVPDEPLTGDSNNDSSLVGNQNYSFTETISLDSLKGRFEAILSDISGVDGTVETGVSIGESLLTEMLSDSEEREFLASSLDVYRKYINSSDLEIIDGYTIKGQQFDRIHYNGSTVEYPYRESVDYTSIPGLKSVEKIFDWQAKYSFNNGCGIYLDNNLILNTGSGYARVIGSLQVPNRSTGDNSANAANTAFVKSEAESIVNAKIKFIDATVNLSSQNISINASSYSTITLWLGEEDASNNLYPNTLSSGEIPSGYVIKNAWWKYSSSPGDITATSISVSNDYSISIYVRNFTSSNVTVHQITLTLLCVPE